jgi:hypothetical protein
VALCHCRNPYGVRKFGNCHVWAAPDDLGGGVFRKRLDKNRQRSIILAKAGSFWVYEYLFAKKDRPNISQTELADYRVLAKGYSGLTGAQLEKLLKDGDIKEICSD